MCPASGWYVPAGHLAHEPCAVAFCAVPALHSSGCCAPVLQKLPARHVWQSPAASSPVALPNRPAGQDSAALLPSGQYTPSPHASHAVAPAEPCIVPAAHAVQLLKPLALALLPAAHGIGRVAPVLQLYPGQHGVHCSSEVTPLELPKRPELQGSAAEAPCSQ